MLKVFTDGGARGNPGPAACAFVVWEAAGNLREKRGKFLGNKTNNEAEYAGVIEALSFLRNLSDLRDLKIDLFLDSLLVVNQLNGLWKVKEARLRELMLQVRSLENGLTVTYSHVSRSQNKEADLLVNETLDGQMR
ncbi:ribonuclease HI family protein [Patescibacteria group bacterium]|nr:ribonuclease HI family protein [Patescibacteria group bacterium]